MAVVAAVLSLAPVASAGIRQGAADDEQDGSYQYDLAHASTSIDSSRGTLSITLRFHQPVPEPDQYGIQNTYVDISSSSSANPDYQTCTFYSGSDLSVSFDPEEGQAVVRPDGDSSSSRSYPFTISPDRRTFELSATDPWLASRDMRCFRVSQIVPGPGDSIPETALVPAAGPLPDCARIGAQPALAVSGLAGRVAWGRDTGFTVEAIELDDYVGAGHLAMRDSETEWSFFDDPFGDEHLRALSTTEPLGYFIRLDRGDSPANVVLTWNQYAGYEDCAGSSVNFVRGFTGAAPRVSAQSDHARAYLSFYAHNRRGCEQARKGRIVVRIGRKRMTLSDLCGRWGRRPRVRGISIARRNDSADYYPSAAFRSALRGNRTRRYRVRVSIGKRRLLTRTLVSRSIYKRAKRIFEGSDAFWNYCIVHERPLRLRGGRFYCVRPGERSRRVFWRR